MHYVCRDYGGQHGQGGSTAETIQDEINDMRDLVKRDRGHRSVFAWSFCNEVGCNNGSSAEAFRAISKLWDPTRAVTQNHLGSDVSTQYLDVQGFSHKHSSDFERFHKSHPEKPIMATECESLLTTSSMVVLDCSVIEAMCLVNRVPKVVDLATGWFAGCSCMSQRGVDQDMCPHPQDGGCVQGPNVSAGVFYNSNIGQCTAEQVRCTYVTPAIVFQCNRHIQSSFLFIQLCLCLCRWTQQLPQTNLKIDQSVTVLCR